MDPPNMPFAECDFSLTMSNTIKGSLRAEQELPEIKPLKRHSGKINNL